MADGGREGGTRGEKWAAEVHGGGRGTGQCRWGCHPSDRSDQRAACKKVEQFCFVPNRPSGSRPQLSPGSSTCSPHRVVGKSTTSRLRVFCTLQSRVVLRAPDGVVGFCLSRERCGCPCDASQNAPLFRCASGAVQPLWRGAGQLSSQVSCKYTSTRQNEVGCKGGGDAGQSLPAGISAPGTRLKPNTQLAGVAYQPTPPF